MWIFVFGSTLFTSSKLRRINLPALQLQKMVGIKSYKSIYRIKNTILKTLAKQKDMGEYDPEIITEFIADFR